MLLKIKDFVSLIDDHLFKEALAHKDNRLALKYFIEVMFDIPNIPLHSLEVEYESYAHKQSYIDKNIRLDLVVKFNNIVLNIEVYKIFGLDSLYKSITYWNRLMSNIKQGDNYLDAPSVKQLNIVDKVHKNLNLPKDFKTNYHLTNKEYPWNVLVKDKHEISIIRVDALANMPYNENDLKERWIRFICAKSEEERLKIAKGDEILMSLHDWMAKYVNNELYYEQASDLNNRVTCLSYSEDIYNNGVKVGIDRGITQGIIQGKIQNQKEIISNMKNKGYSPKEISEIVGLPEAQIN